MLRSHRKERQRTIAVTRHKSPVQLHLVVPFVGPQVHQRWMLVHSCAQLFCTLLFAAKLVLKLLPEYEDESNAIKIVNASLQTRTKSAGDLSPIHLDEIRCAFLFLFVPLSPSDSR